MTSPIFKKNEFVEYFFVAITSLTVFFHCAISVRTGKESGG